MFKKKKQKIQLCRECIHYSPRIHWLKCSTTSCKFGMIETDNGISYTTGVRRIERSYPNKNMWVKRTSPLCEGFKKKSIDPYFYFYVAIIICLSFLSVFLMRGFRI